MNVLPSLSLDFRVIKEVMFVFFASEAGLYCKNNRFFVIGW